VIAAAIAPTIPVNWLVGFGFAVIVIAIFRANFWENPRYRWIGVCGSTILSAIVVVGGYALLRFVPKPEPLATKSDFENWAKNRPDTTQHESDPRPQSGSDKPLTRADLNKLMEQYTAEHVPKTGNGSSKDPFNDELRTRVKNVVEQLGQNVRQAQESYGALDYKVKGIKEEGMMEQIEPDFINNPSNQKLFVEATYLRDTILQKLRQPIPQDKIGGSFRGQDLFMQLGKLEDLAKQLPE
jgi:hypothetical protein